MDDRLISLKKALAEIDAMPPIKAEGHDFIEKTCLKTRLKLLSPAQPSVSKTEIVEDTISRQAAIDALDKVAEMFPYRIPGNAKTYRQYNEAWSDAIDAAENALEALPSAQPDVSDTNVGDMISRQAAIAEIMEDLEDRSLHDDPATPEDYAEGYDEGIRNAAAIVLQMPSSQPGWIPCSERLPEKAGQYYVSGGNKVWICEFLIIPNFIGGWCNDAVNPVVQAWMPLPTPYREGDKNG